MPRIHATKRYWRVRIHEPSRYVRMRTKKLGKRGIKAIIGVRPISGKRGGRTEIQAYLIPKALDGHLAKQYARKYRR
jgi:hypothetical protein